MVRVPPRPPGRRPPGLRPGSADFARARVLAALDLLSWLDHRYQPLDALTQADLDQWLTEGTTTRRAVRYFIQWARARHLTGDVSVPLPPRSEPVRLLGEDDHIRQLDRCLSAHVVLACGRRPCGV
jgi:hypothetical protein